MKENYSLSTTRAHLSKIGIYFSNSKFRGSEENDKNRWAKCWSFIFCDASSKFLSARREEGKLRSKKNGGQSYRRERETMICALAKFLSFTDELCFPTLAFPSIIKGNDTTGHSRFMALSLSLFLSFFFSLCRDFRAYTRKNTREGRARPLHNS